MTPAFVALLGARPDEDAVAALWAAARAEAGLDEALAALGAVGFARLPSFALVGRHDTGTRVVVRGQVVVEALGPDNGGEPIVGGEVLSWAEHTLRSDGPVRLRLGVGPAPGEAPGPFVVDRGLVAADALDVPALDVPALVASGAVAPVPAPPEPPAPAMPPPAPEMLVVPRPPVEDPEPVEAATIIPPPRRPRPQGAPPAPAPEPTPAASPDPDHGGPPGALTVPVPRRPAAAPASTAPPAAAAPPPDAPPTREVAVASGDHDGETIMAEEVRRLLGTPSGSGAAAGSVTIDGQYVAVRCPVGHLNPSHGHQCRACGEVVTSQVPELVARPDLGEFRFSTGAVVRVDRPLLIGRAPKVSGEVRGPMPELVAVPSPDQDISRTHLEVRVEGWQVLLVDKGSTNGTTVLLPDRDPQRLRPDHPYPLPVGAVVSLADEVEFTFEADR